MDRRLLVVAAVLLVLAAVTVPAVATLPPKNPLPPGSAFNTIWDLLVDLQNQIHALKTQIANVPAGPQGPAGPTGDTGPQGPAGAAGPAMHFGAVERIPVEAGAPNYGDTAETDGMVTCIVWGTEYTFVDGEVTLPTGQRYQLATENGVEDQSGYTATISMAVAKGERWFVFWGPETTEQVQLYWRPLVA